LPLSFFSRSALLAKPVRLARLEAMLDAVERTVGE
jgi:hypothetical protein